MDHKREIINDIQSIAGRYSPYEVFSDWIRSAALAIQNSIDLFHGKLWKEREQEYLSTANKYTPAELKKICGLTGHLTMALEENLEDVLGDVYMKSNMGSKQTGQFFTPYNLSRLTAQLAIGENLKEEDGMIAINEPSCGGGGMIIAACAVLKDAGINYQTKLDVVAQDLDWKSVYMTYLQLSLIGCRAIVVQGDTLITPFDPAKTDRAHMLFTPARLGMLE